MKRLSPRDLFSKILLSSAIAIIAGTINGQIPTITSFNPVSGSIGTSVTISGTNFSTTLADNVVWFGAVRAIVNSATTNSLTVDVPAGATYQPISVTVNGLTAYSGKPFIVTITGTNILQATSFATKVDLSPGSYGYGVVIGDIDGDGKPDLIVSNWYVGTISVYRNISTSGSISESSFESKVDLATGSGPYGVAFSDIDGDGKPDIIVVNAWSSSISVFRNNSIPGSITAGSFDSRVDFPTGAVSFYVAVGDIDGDGKPDMAVTNNSNNTISVYRNTSTSGTIDAGSFESKVDFTTGYAPRGIVIGDIDGDGKPDLAVANPSSNNVSVFRNVSVAGSISTSSFETRIDFSTVNSSDVVEIGDIDGDNKPDLVVTSSSGLFSVLRNISASGSISFDPRVDFNIGSAINFIDIGDLDGDSKPDLAIANTGGNSISVFKNTSTSGIITTSSFTDRINFPAGTQTYVVAIGDIDGDGKQDLVASNYGSNNLSVLRNRISEPFPVITSFAPTSGPVGTEVKITGTHFCTTPEKNFVWFGAVQAAVSVASETELTVTVPAGATYQPITVTANGYTDYSNVPFKVTFPCTRLIDASSFAPKVDITSASAPWSSAYLSDIDCDGKPDIVSANGSGNIVSVLRNISSAGTITAGSFSPGVDIISGASVYNVAIDDIDGDGKPDLVLANFNNNTVSVLRNKSTPGSVSSGSFDPKVDFATGSNPWSVATADIDVDGKPDIIVTNVSGLTITVLRNTSTPGSITGGSFAPGIEFSTGAGPMSSVAVGDIDGDGKPEIAVANNGSAMISVFRNTSTPGSITTASLAPKVNFATGSYPRGVIIRDLDGDGKPDLYVANNSSNTISIFRNTSAFGAVTANSFADRVDLETGTNPICIATGDINGDGKPDLVVANHGSNTISVFRNRSIPGSISSDSFTSKTDFATGSNPASAGVGDLDGDGKPDVFVRNTLSNSVSVFWNALSEPISPVISSFIPTSGPIGTNVIITGTNFCTTASENIVRFGSVNATVISATASQLSVIVPSGASTQPVSVEVNELTAISGPSFIVTVAPVITSYSPLSGPVGTEVLITGTNFSAIPAENTVLFGTVPATVTAASATQLTVTVPPGALSMPVSVTVTSLTATTASSFIVTIPPTVMSFSPASGPVGTTVTIDGSNFSTNISNNIVKFGTVQAEVNSATASQLIVVVPSGAATQPVSVTVDELTAYSGTSFIVTIPPVITTYSPLSGPVGTEVLISGTNFSDTPVENTVLFGTVPATVTAASATQLTITVPPGALSMPISVTVTSLTATTGSSFIVTIPPTIMSFSPASGPVGTTVTINGSNFSTNISNNIVKFGTVQAAVISATASQLSIIVPSGAATQPVSVTVDELTAYTGTSFIVTVPPVITTYSPLSGPVGTEVLISGTNFSDIPLENTVLFGTVPATVTSASATQLTVSVPPGAMSMPISVTVTSLTATTGSSFIVTIPPTVMSFSPASGPVGTTVTINGSNFSTDISNNIVKFGTVQAAVISATASQLSIIVPSGAATQPVSVTVDELTAYTGTSFIVTVPPTITSFSPASGPVGTEVTINGTNFSAILTGNSVSFGASPAMVTAATSSQLTVIVPGGATTQVISLIVNGLQVTSGTFFTVTVPPGIMSFNPASGPVGTTVTIYGSNFSPIISNNIVKFGSVQAVIVSATSTQLTVTVPPGSITQPISVTTDGMTASTGTSFNVTVPPTITSFSPSSGPVGTEVTITGTNFSEILTGNSVSFGAIQALVTEATTTQLTVIVPSGATSQAIHLTVNGFLVNSATSFNVTFPPNIMYFMPTSGPVGTTVTISGSNFSSNISNNIVKFGTVQAAVISASTIELIAIVPAGATSQPVSVSTDGLTASTITSFNVTVPPTVTSFSPVSGPVGTTVTIEGTNFNPVPTDNIVRFGTELAVVSSASATQLTVVVPAGAVTQPIYVTANMLTANSGTSFTVTAPVSDPPVITTFSPASGAVGTTVIINGSNFSTNISNNLVKFGSLQAAVISATATQLTAIVPSGATTQPIFVTVNGLTAFTIVSFVISPPPVINSFSPASGPVGTIVTIEGSNFGSTPGSNSVFFGTVSASVYSVTLTQLTVIVPSGATNQLINVTSNGLTTSSATAFTVTTSVSDPPVITSFSPASGPVGTTVTITGSNFGSDIASNTVKFGTVQATVISATPGQLSVIVPPAAITQSVFVTVNGLTANSNTSFIVVYPPSITSFSPSSGQIGTSVTIYGNNFSPVLSDNTVMFGSVQATVTAGTITQLTVIVPSISIAQQISVTVNGMTATSFTVFTVIIPPTIAAFSPLSGIVGTTVTITGSDFSSNISNNTVRFGNVQAAVISATTNQLSVIVPAGATTQPLNVTVNGLTATSAGSFIIIFPPIINSFSPQSGTVGTSVTISGSNFSTTAVNNTVRFGSVQATVIAATETQISVTVPAGAISQPVSVTVNGLTTYSSIPFNVPPPQPPVINSFSPASGPVGTSVKITGMNFSHIPSDNNVSFGGNQAVVTEASGTQLTVTVPDASGNLQILVTVNGLTGNSNNPFSVTTGGDNPSFNSFALESSVITLNGDGINDRLVVQNFDIYGKCDISIYNSRGLLIFSQKDYQNDWDMTINGRQLLTGGYFYVAQTEKGVFRGSFSILTQF